MHVQYHLGKVIGAGSFGVVRECVEVATGRKYAVKSIGKAPKRGMATPRYLLKLRTEIEIMQQLGYSLDAVNLKVSLGTRSCGGSYWLFAIVGRLVHFLGLLTTLFWSQDAFEDDDSVHLVMEVCEGGVLLERVEKDGYSEQYVVRIIRSVLRFISQV